MATVLKNMHKLGVTLGLSFFSILCSCSFSTPTATTQRSKEEIQFLSTQWTVYKYNRSLKGCFDPSQRMGLHTGGLATECADYRNKDLTDMNFQGLNLMGSQFSGVQGKNISFKNSNLMGAALKGILAEQVLWTGAYFDEATVLPFTKAEAILRGMVFKDLAQLDRELLLGIQLGKVNEVKKLLEMKADAFQPEALIFAVDHPSAYAELVHLLIDRGVSVDQLSSSGSTVLASLIDRLSYSNKSELLLTKIKFLLSLGADANVGATQDQGTSALTRAVRGQTNSQELVELLLKAGANPNQKGRGCDPLFNEIRNPEVLKMFIDYGAEIAGTYYEGVCLGKSRSYLMALLSDSKNFKISQNISAQQFVHILQLLESQGQRLTTIEKNQQGRSIFISAIRSLELDAQKLIVLSDSGFLLKIPQQEIRQLVSEILEKYYQLNEPTQEIETRLLEILEVAKKLNLDFEGRDSKHKSLLSRLLEMENIRADKVFLTYLKTLPLTAFKDTAMDNLTEKLLRRSLKKPQLLVALEYLLINDENLNGTDRGGYPLINLCERADCFFQFVDHGFDISKTMSWERSRFLNWFFKNKFKLWSNSEKMQWLKTGFQNQKIMMALSQSNEPLLPWIYSLRLGSDFYQLFFQAMVKQDHFLSQDLQKNIVCGDGHQFLKLHFLEILTQSVPEEIQLNFQLSPSESRAWKVHSYQVLFENKALNLHLKTDDQNFIFKIKDLQDISLIWGAQKNRTTCHLSF